MTIALLVCASLVINAKPGLEAIEASAIAAHVRFLADDLLEGRGTGERGHAIAERYVVAQMEILGLRPAGDGGTFLQQVLLRDVEIDPERTRAELPGTSSLRLFEDFLPIVPSTVDADVAGPLVLVGYGVQVPEAGIDDFRDVDLRGKFAVWLTGAPSLPALSPSERALAGDPRMKWKTAAARGAVGFVSVLTPERLRVASFEASARSARRRTVAPADPQPLGPGVVPRPEVAQALLATAGHSVEKLVERAGSGHPITGDLPGRAHLRIFATAKDLRSNNVVGLLPATAPDLREVLAISAHLDHLGIGDPVNGDAIYNGAVDNATGIAEMLEIARAMAAQPARKRGVVFLAFTGEELGLLGSAWFVKNPTVPLAEVVADLNLDQLSPMWKPHDVVLRGAEQSTLEDHVRAAATALGFSISADPVPEQNFFFRSDQYNFARAGVPAACLWQGFKDDKGRDSNGDIFRRWRSTRYHHPDDDLSQPFDWEAAASWARFEFLVGYSVVQGARPKWKE